MSDASATPNQQTRGELAEEISRSVVRLFKEQSGKGPDKCRTYLEDDLVMVVMRGGYSRAEHTLIADGKWLDVRAMRHTLQDTMEGRLTEIIERETGRKVLAFMSASHENPDVQLETFMLDGQAPSETA